MDEFGLNIAGGEDEADFCRGYGAETNEGYDENYFPVDDDDDYNSGTGAYTENEDLDKAPEMPQNFYKDVESFLTRDPPKLKDTSKKTKLKNNKKGVVLPDIYSKQSNEINPPQPPQVTSKVRSKLLNTTNKQPQRQFDHNLLRDAFAYTDQLLKDALMEEASSTNSGNHESSSITTGQQGLPPRRAMKKDTKGSNTGNGQKKLQSRTIPVESIYIAPHPHSAPSGSSSNTKKKTDIYSSNSGYHSSAGSSNSGPKGIVKKLRAKVPSESNISTTNTGFSTDTTLDNNNNKRNAVNFDELISNFQDGIMLSKLRQELEDSKQSMKKSENFMRQLSQEYLGKGKKF